MILLAAAYYISGVLSLRLALVRGQVTPIWPPTGIAVVALLLFGRRLWPGIAVAAFFVNAPISPSPLVAAGIAAGNTLAPLFAATLLRKSGFRTELDRLRDAISIVVLAALLGMTISATAGTATLVLSGSVPARQFWPTWSVWWAGDAMGVLIVAPFLFSLKRLGRRSSTTWRRSAEVAVLFVSLAVVARWVFSSDLQIEYLVFLLLGLVAWRFGQGGAASAALLASGIAIWAAVRGTGPFAHASLVEQMVTLQVFNASAAFASFVLAAVMAERQKDIADRKRAEEQLAHRALHDPLTGLPNRMLFMDRLNHALAGLERRPASVAVLFLDLDRFKVVNDRLGHHAGDEVLRCVAERLRGALRPGDTASRFGGDEFLVLCQDVEGERDAVRIAERVAGSVAQPIHLGAGELVVTTSVGIAMPKGPADQPDALVHDADTAVYRAKERGRNRYELFDHEMRARAVRRLDTEIALGRAIEGGELRLHYQPLMRLADGRIAAMEALVRWEHPARGLLPPSEFIPAAEETGLIAPLGAWVLAEACRQLARWRSPPLARQDLTIAVNVSAGELAHPEFEQALQGALSETGLEGSSLSIEISESVLVDAPPSTITVLHDLRDRGVRLAIDDFGKGYSALGYMRHSPVDTLKVAGSFVRGGDPGDSVIVAAAVSLAHALGLSVVAEGVETAAQLERLRAVGCGLAQGFYFARPQRAEEAAELIRSDSVTASP
jgi:diguanylate cyclase (GGDEF)-like protein